MKQSIYYLAAVLTVLTLAACGNDEKKEPPYEPPPYRPVTMSFENESLDEIQKAITGKWIRHSVHLYDSYEWDLESQTFVPSTALRLTEISSFTFNGTCIVLDYEKSAYREPRETICDLYWNKSLLCPAYLLRGEDDCASDYGASTGHGDYRVFEFQRIEKDTLFIWFMTHFHESQLKVEYLKLTKQH